MLPDTSILDIEQETPGKLWIATLNSGVYRYESDELKQFGSEAGLPNAAVRDLYLSPTGGILSATTQGVYRLENEFFNPLEGSAPHLNAPCYSIAETLDGKLWIATDSAGVGIYDGENWSSLDQRDGIAGNSVFQILPRHDGSLWLGTSGGLSMHRPRSVEIFGSFGFIWG